MKISFLVKKNVMQERNQQRI